MLRAVAELSGRAGIRCEVSLEERMACGVGACLVCACRTKKDGADMMSRVCSDGPVFDAREVVW
jgi:dihydroorotate dehydrogenase electron transfer subunit